MAERRMFAKTIIDSDFFLEMPLTTQCLYFHLSMRADDEGFINNPKKIMRMIGASEDDLKVLISKKYILWFQSGVIVVKHWKIHNYIRGDRLTPTQYQDERAMLDIKENGVYSIQEGLIPLDESEDKSTEDKRKEAYKKSSLPYSFEYKIKRAFDGRECPVCKCIMTSTHKESQPSVQHNVPISLGGEHEIDNISIICLHCNTSIQDRITDPMNNDDVIKAWDTITEYEKIGVKWFENPEKIWENKPCQTTDGQLSVNCQSIVSQDEAECQHRLGKDRLVENSKGYRNTSCTEPETVSMPEPVVISLPLNDGSLWPVTQSYADQLKTLYPAVDVDQELRKMYGWLDSKQSNRKTKRGIKAFITNWLSKSQDKARSYAPVRGNTYQTRNQRVDSDLVDWCRAVEGR